MNIAVRNLDVKENFVFYRLQEEVKK